MVYQVILGFPCYSRYRNFSFQLFFLRRRSETDLSGTREPNRSFHSDTLVQWPHFNMTVLLLICVSYFLQCGQLLGLQAQRILLVCPAKQTTLVLN
jgi:hypothetical protein